MILMIYLMGQHKMMQHNQIKTLRIFWSVLVMKKILMKTQITNHFLVLEMFRLPFNILRMRILTKLSKNKLKKNYQHLQEIIIIQLMMINKLMIQQKSKMNYLIFLIVLVYNQSMQMQIIIMEQRKMRLIILKLNILMKPTKFQFLLPNYLNPNNHLKIDYYLKIQSQY